MAGDLSVREAQSMAKIMIVDDAAFLRAMLRDILVQAGHEVVIEAGNGKEAVERYMAFKPDVVTMDITMPIMEGVEAVKEIRRFDPNASIVMCSAFGQRNQVIEAIQNGAKDFIMKPFHSTRVLEAVDKAISS
jgi:two-component system chemotaxis response regulator CheY